MPVEDIAARSHAVGDTVDICHCIEGNPDPPRTHPSHASARDSDVHQHCQGKGLVHVVWKSLRGHCEQCFLGVIARRPVPPVVAVPIVGGGFALTNMFDLAYGNKLQRKSPVNQIGRSAAFCVSAAGRGAQNQLSSHNIGALTHHRQSQRRMIVVGAGSWQRNSIMTNEKHRMVPPTQAPFTLYGDAVACTVPAYVPPAAHL